MKNEIAIFEPGLEEYPKASIILGNLAMIFWIALGTIACWFFSPLAAWIYLALAIIVIGVILRKLVCTNCYYYDKWCSTGWGKLSALLFKQGSIDKFNSSIGIKLAPVTYGLLLVIPLILVIISAVREFTAPKVVVLAFLLVVAVYSGFINRMKACTDCRMRLVCPGCAVKSEDARQTAT